MCRSLPLNYICVHLIQILDGSFDVLSVDFGSLPCKFKADSMIGAKTELYSIIVQVFYSNIQQLRWYDRL